MKGGLAAATLALALVAAPVPAPAMCAGNVFATCPPRPAARAAPKPAEAPAKTRTGRRTR